MYTSKFRVCRILFIAGSVWICTVLTLFYYWELIMEHQLRAQKFSKNPTDDNLVNFQRLEAEPRAEPAPTTKIPFYVTKKRQVMTLKEHTTTREATTTSSTTSPATTTTTSTTVRKTTTTTPKRRMYERVVATISPEVYKTLGLGENPGEAGRPIKISDPPADIKKKIEDGWARHEFNEFLSDLISVNRSVPDPRSMYCRKEGLYLNELPTTSVIIIFHNEAWSTLLRSVHSVINRSPPHLVKEIILVDDYSNMLHLKEALEDYMSDFPKVRIVRMEKRVGLIKARIAGTNAATAPTLTFLDSHIECAEGWLEPLLDRIARDKTKVVCPVIDVIDDDTLGFSYQDSSGLQVGGFDWEMTFDWHMVPSRERKRKKDQSEPTFSPTMAGGLFSIDKAFFERLGTYDDGFDIWGAENLELSFKTWMCGGTLEIIPCSHVGHIFRKKSPYKWRPGVDVLKINTVRLVEVWLDEYSRYYYVRRGSHKGDFGDISKRVELRKNLNCKSFKWYLENVWPEMTVPDNIAEGWIRSKGINNPTCFDAAFENHDSTSRIAFYGCHDYGGNQFFEFSTKHEIKRKRHCLDYSNSTNELKFVLCHGAKGDQYWDIDVETRQIYHRASNKCLEIFKNNYQYEPTMQECDEKNNNQKWDFQYLYEEKLLGGNKTTVAV